MALSQEEFENVVRKCVEYLREKAPKDTGTLAYDAIQVIFRENEAVIYVDEKIAPYMVFTNEPWITPRGKKKQGPPHNPNEHWFNRAAKGVARMLRKELKGK